MNWIAIVVTDYFLRMIPLLLFPSALIWVLVQLSLFSFILSQWPFLHEFIQLVISYFKQLWIIIVIWKLIYIVVVPIILLGHAKLASYSGTRYGIFNINDNDIQIIHFLYACYILWYAISCRSSYSVSSFLCLLLFAYKII